MTVYVATNINTGEVIEGGARYLSRKLGVTTAFVYKATSTQKLIKSVWSVDKIDTENNTPYRLPQALLDEWDAVTQAIRRKTRRV